MAYIFDVYDNAGGQSLSGTTTTLNLDTIRLENPNDSSSPFDLTSDVITISEDAKYIFHYRATIDYSTGTATTADQMYVYLDRDTGSGYVEVDGSRAFLEGAKADSDKVTGSATVALDVSSGDKFRLRISKASLATYVTVADASGLCCWRDETGGAGGGAPTDASYLVAGSNGTLTDERVATSGEGVAVSSTSSAGTAVFNLNFPGLTTYTGAGATDYICVYDNTAKEHKRLTWSELFRLRDAQDAASSALAVERAWPETLIGLAEHSNANITSGDLAGDLAADAEYILQDYLDNGTNAGLDDPNSRAAIFRAIQRLKRYQAIEDGGA